MLAAASSALYDLNRCVERAENNALRDLPSATLSIDEACERLNSSPNEIPEELAFALRELGEIATKSKIEQAGFFSRLARGCHTFFGIEECILDHDAHYHFAALGRYAERAQNSLRLVAAANSTPITLWGRQFAPEVLLHSRTYPRSVISCLMQIELHLRALAGEQKGLFGSPLQRMVRRLTMELNYADVRDTAALGSFGDRMAKLDSEIYSTYQGVFALQS